MSNFVKFGAYELDLRARELRKHGLKIKLPDQSVRILAMLLECPGQVVLREEIQKKLWANDTIVEFDHSINAAVKRLRRALSDEAETPRYVETLPRRGYRFIFPVDNLGTDRLPNQAALQGQHASEIRTDLNRLKRESDSGCSATPAVVPTAVQQATGGTIIAQRQGAKSRELLFAFCASVAVFLVAAGWIFLSRHPDEHLPTRVVPFTGLSGLEFQPAFSTRRQSVSFR